LKCSAIDVNGEWHDVYKQPITDPGKDSRAGRFVVLKHGQEFETIANGGKSHHREDQLEVVLEDGVLKRDQTLEEIRRIATSYDNFSKKPM
jgi:nicotinamide phosphoribosyltransferase